MRTSSYRLTKRLLGYEPFIELSREQFELIHGARDTLITALELEELYAVVIANFVEHENTLLQLTVESASGQT